MGYSDLPENSSVLRRGLSRAEAARYVGVSPGTFDKMVSNGEMPLPKCVRSRKIWDCLAIEIAFDALPVAESLTPADKRGE